MDVPATSDALTFNPQPNPQPSWAHHLDIIYSHALLWPTVPGHSQAMELWLRRLVQFEVSLLFSSCPQLNVTQDELIVNARLEAFSEVQLDTWFAARGVPRSKLRFLVSSYAKLHWPTTFPRYASHLQDELSHYHAVLSAAIARRRTPGVVPDPDTLRLAHKDARQLFRSHVPQGSLLGDVPLLRCTYRLAMADLEILAPSPPYDLPALDDDVYSHQAPLPERAPLPPQVPPQVHVDLPLAVEALPNIHPGPHDHFRGSPVLRAVSILDIGEPPPVTRGHGRGRPRGRPRGRGRARGQQGGQSRGGVHRRGRSSARTT
jgi:hypothetical protein